MKRDFDFINWILLRYEAGLRDRYTLVYEDLFKQCHQQPLYGKLVHHLWLLEKQGLLVEVVKGGMPNTLALTWAGYDYLDELRRRDAIEQGRLAAMNQLIGAAEDRVKERGYGENDVPKDLVRANLRELGRNASLMTKDGIRLARTCSRALKWIEQLEERVKLFEYEQTERVESQVGING